MIQGEICLDHVYMLVEISSSLRVSSFVGDLKGNSMLTTLEKHANLKYKYWNRYFWRR